MTPSFLYYRRLVFNTIISHKTQQAGKKGKKGREEDSFYLRNSKAEYNILLK